jgi:hypothetical protein
VIEPKDGDRPIHLYCAVFELHRFLFSRVSRIVRAAGKINADLMPYLIFGAGLSMLAADI